MHWVPPLITSAASANLFELAALSIIWLLWLVGCVVSTVSDYVSPIASPSCTQRCPLQSIWPNLSFCYQFAPCRILSAMMAFAWLGWIALVILIVLAVLTAVQKARPARSPMMVEWAAANTFARPQFGGSAGSGGFQTMREVV